MRTPSGRTPRLLSSQRRPGPTYAPDTGFRRYDEHGVRLAKYYLICLEACVFLLELGIVQRKSLGGRWLKATDCARPLCSTDNKETFAFHRATPVQGRRGVAIELDLDVVEAGALMQLLEPCLVVEAEAVRVNGIPLRICSGFPTETRRRPPGLSTLRISARARTGSGQK
jgi:hypothetical protein